MEYAVIETGGKQYKTNKGDVLEIESLGEVKTGDEVIFDRVLMLVADGKVELGKPFLPDVSVVASVVENMRGEKIRVSKFKAKSRYRRVTGHRQSLTKVEIKDIVVKTKTAVKKAK